MGSVQASVSAPPRICIDASINGEEVSLEFDTGSSITALAWADWKRCRGKSRLQKAPKIECLSYSGHGVKLRGCAEVEVRIGEKQQMLLVYIVNQRMSIFR